MQIVQTGGVRRFKLTWGDGVGAACFIAAMFNPFTRYIAFGYAIGWVVVLCYRLSAESGNDAVADEKAVKTDSENM
jgi:hypothetical protein